MNRPLAAGPDWVDGFIEASLREDVGDGDHSTLACIPAGQTGTFRLLVKQDGVMAGVRLAERIFRHAAGAVEMEIALDDGALAGRGETAFRVTGDVRGLLTAERLALNCMQRMGGIATLTRELSERIAHTGCKLLDTRKTTPLFRMPEKWAVRIGGGVNHRIGLFDMIMLKDNHIDACGGIPQALQRTKTYLESTGRRLPVVVECRTIEDVRQCLDHREIHRLLLDNMTPDRLREAVSIARGIHATEASGNITAANLVSYAETGVDYLSMGALTHSARPIDMSLKLES